MNAVGLLHIPLGAHTSRQLVQEHLWNIWKIEENPEESPYPKKQYYAHAMDASSFTFLKSQPFQKSRKAPSVSYLKSVSTYGFRGQFLMSVSSKLQRALRSLRMCRCPLGTFE